MPIDWLALGKRIQTMRKKRGYSQNELSEIIDKSPCFLSYIESGVKGMSLETFVELTNALNSSADTLLIDSLNNTIICTSSSFTEVISDCSAYEQRVLLDLVISMKESLRANQKFLTKKDKGVRQW